PHASSMTAATLDRLHSDLAGRGSRYIQCNWDVDDAAPPFAAAGYRRLAQLDYLAADVPDLLQRLQDVSTVAHEFSWRNVDPAAGPGNRRRWVRLVEQTFDAALDCPMLSEFRSA